MRAVIYARYSSDQQRDASIDDQIRACRGLIEREGWTLVEVYADRAVSGASTLRQAYQSLLADARAAKFDVVVAEGLDRLSRDQEDVAALYKRLAYASVIIVTVAEGAISDLHVGLKGTMNALYLKDLAQKTRRGLEGRVRAGRSAGGLCYGYDVVPAREGEPRGERRIDAAEAEVVRRIFREFAAGTSPKAIARRLNADGVPGPRGKPWWDSAIRGHRQRGTGILNNELYVGRLVWNRLRYVKDPETGRRRSRRNDADDLIVEPVPQLRIVDDRLWQAVKARQAAIDARPGVQAAKASRFWERRRATHLLTGLVVCGTCGAAYASVGLDYVACRQGYKQHTCTNRRSVRRARVEDAILDLLKDRLMTAEAVAAFTTAYTAEVNRSRAEAGAEHEHAERRLRQVERKIATMIRAIEDGLYQPSMKARMAELEAEKADLTRRLARTPEPQPVRLHPNLAEVYRRKVEELRLALADPLIRDEALDLLRGLIDKVVITPADDALDVEVVGELARMVDLTTDKAKPPRSGRTRRRYFGKGGCGGPQPPKLDTRCRGLEPRSQDDEKGFSQAESPASGRR